MSTTSGRRPELNSAAGKSAIDPAVFARRLDEAAAHFAAGRLDAAAQIYRQLERAAPGDVRAAFSLAMIDLHQGRLARARQRLETIVVQQPQLVSAQHNLGAVRQQMGAWPEAAEAYAATLALRPDAIEFRAALAIVQAMLGRTAEAIEQHRILAHEPARRWAALTRIALLDAEAIDDEELTAMQRAAGGADTEANTRIGLEFALGEVFEWRGRPGDAFAAWASGNELKRAMLAGGQAPPTVAAANAAAAAYLETHFDAGFIATHAGRAGQPAVPIFVVGFPRCGSTLVEQILASHPAVQGMGETGVLSDLLQGGYPGSAAGFRDLADRYLAKMRESGWDGASRFIDKTLENYLHVGAIVLMFPKATILHVARDPMDTSFACYRQLFASGNETLYDLAEIGAEYRRYRGLMAHWDAVLPGRVVEVNYESLANDPDQAIPALVTQAAGLSWDAACMRFFEREGAVRTASAAQVRRPVYATSVQRWRRHAAALAPLAQALGPYGPQDDRLPGSGANDGT